MSKRNKGRAKRQRSYSGAAFQYSSEYKTWKNNPTQANADAWHKKFMPRGKISFSDYDWSGDFDLAA